MEQQTIFEEALEVAESMLQTNVITVSQLNNAIDTVRIVFGINTKGIRRYLECKHIIHAEAIELEVA